MSSVKNCIIIAWDQPKQSYTSTTILEEHHQASLMN